MAARLSERWWSSRGGRWDGCFRDDDDGVEGPEKRIKLTLELSDGVGTKDGIVLRCCCWNRRLDDLSQHRKDRSVLLGHASNLGEYDYDYDSQRSYRYGDSTLPSNNK